MRKSLLTICLALACAALLAPAAVAAARPGTIDRAFAGGLLKQGFGLEPGSGGAEHVALQADGKAIVLVPSTYLPLDYSLARLTVDGALDPSFGSGGFLSGGFGIPGSQAVDLAVQPDGKILVAGRVWTPRRFAVTRYTPDGQLDTGFGEGGTAYFDEDAGITGGMLLQPDGKIVLSGVDYPTLDEPPHGDELKLVRLNGDGTIDRGFGDRGVAAIPVPTDYRNSAQQLVWHDGSLIVASLGDSYALVAKFAADGSPDRSYGDAGAATVLTRSRTIALAVQPDGKALIGGEVVSRLMPDGSPDPAFSSDGAVEMPAEVVANSVSVQADGLILLAGVRHDPGYMPVDFALLRLNPDGGFDSGFGGGSGYLTTDIAGGQRDEALDSVALPGGGQLLVGRSYSDAGGGSGITVVSAARYRPDGSLDPSFGGDGTVDLRPMTAAKDMVFDLVVDGRGGVVATGRGGGKVTTARFLPNGAPDPGFGSSGVVSAQVSGAPLGEQGTSILRYPDGRILVGTGSAAGGALLRYLPDGQPDFSFGSHGVVATPGLDQVADLAFDAKGRIVAAGMNFEPCARVLARFDENGAPDPSFGVGGAVRQGLAGACRVNTVTLALAPRGRILLGGTYGAFLLAFTSSGKRIEGFGRDAKGHSERELPSRLRDVEVDRKGRILVAGTFDGAFGLVRLRPDGSADPSFGRKGLVKTKVQAWSHISALRVQRDGKILAAGVSKPCAARDLCFDQSIAVARYDRDGSLDRGFGRRGILLKRAGFEVDLGALALGRRTAVFGGWVLASGENRQWLLGRLRR